MSLCCQKLGLRQDILLNDKHFQEHFGVPGYKLKQKLRQNSRRIYIKEAKPFKFPDDIANRGRSVEKLWVKITSKSKNSSHLNPLSANPAKQSNTLKQFVSCCRRIVWVCLTILLGLALTGLKLDNYALQTFLAAIRGVFRNLSSI